MNEQIYWNAEFNILSYMKTSLSPYSLNDTAMKLITSLSKRFNRGREEKAQVLLNAASLHPKMSKYQLSLTHKAFGDVYYAKKYLGNALEHYRIGLELNVHLAVKRKIKELSALPESDKLFSCSPDIVANILLFKEYSKYAKELDDQKQRKTRLKERFDQRDYEDSIIDPALEAWISARLDSLGEPYISEFHRICELRRLTRPDDDSLSFKRYALLDLRGMEKSAAYRGDREMSNRLEK